MSRNLMPLFIARVVLLQKRGGRQVFFVSFLHFRENFYPLRLETGPYQAVAPRVVPGAAPSLKRKLLDRMSGQLGEHHPGELKRESAEAKAERIIAEELARLGWTSADLQLRLKRDPGKLQIAARLRGETTLTIKSIALRAEPRA
jgi:hypothetical protein